MFRLCFTSQCVLATVIIGGLAMADSNVDALAKAKTIAAKGDLAGAETVYRQIIKSSSDPALVIPAHEELAILCIQGRRIIEAESLIQNLQNRYAASPETADALYAIALHWNWNGEPQKSLNLHRYNSETFAKTKKGMWSQGAIVNYYIEKKDFGSAEKEFAVMSNRFNDQPTWPQEIHQFGEKYRTTDEPARALELHRYNVEHSPVASMYTMWSQGAIVHHYIRHKEFASAEREIQVMIERFSEQPTLPQELNHIANMLKSEGQVDSGMQLHRFNATQSPSSSKYSMWSQGALIHYFIEQKDFFPAEVEYKELLNRFAEQPTLPQEIYYCALKYQSVGNVEKALELHRYNATTSQESSLYSMQSQGAIVHRYIEAKDFEVAKREIEFLTSRFSQQETFPQELYQFALKYQAVGASEEALELHWHNATQSPVSSMYSMWSQGALIHHFIDQKNYEAAQGGCQAMISQFSDQPTLSHELHLIADKYQGAGQYELSRSLCEYGLATFEDIDSKLNFKEVTVKNLLAENKNSEAESVCSELIALCTNQSHMTRVLKNLGNAYHHAKQWNQAVIYFQKAIQTAKSPEEKLDAHAGVAKSRIRLSSDFSEIGAMLSTILTEYKGCKDVGLRGIQIGEEYYYLGREALENTDSGKAKDYFRQAITLWDQVIKLNADAGISAECYYLTGMSYCENDDYLKAAKAFEMVGQIAPNYKYADHCLFAAADCYDRLMQSGEMASSDATELIRNQFKLLVERFPNSIYASNAKAYLDLN